MSRLLRVGLFLLMLPAVARAQDFRVYTQILDARGQDKPTTVGRSTSLFHAGKVYDCVDSGNQMTVFEPAQKRFVIIDESKRMAAVVPFDALQSMLYREEKRVEERLAGLADGKDRWEVQLARFQLHPEFDTRFDSARKQLDLSSRWLSYSVKCGTSDPVEYGETYLEYADWAARLNFVVHPHAQLPGPRLVLNDALRRRKLLPIEVTCRAHHLHLIARHRFDWKLDGHDRDLIRHWEKLLQSPTVKSVSLGELLAPAAGSETTDKRRDDPRPVARTSRRDG